jgi:hypothetical protein
MNSSSSSGLIYVELLDYFLLRSSQFTMIRVRLSVIARHEAIQKSLTINWIASFLAMTDNRTLYNKRNFAFSFGTKCRFIMTLFVTVCFQVIIITAPSVIAS